MTSSSVRIDARALGEPGTQRVLHAAAADTGAFLLTHHGLDAAQTGVLFAAAQAFFALPQAARDAIDMRRSPYFRGYSRSGSERTQGRPDLREQLDIGPEEEPHPRAAQGPPYLRLQGPNLWPCELPALRSSSLAWMRAAGGVARRLLDAVADAFALPADALDAAVANEPHERMKIIRYPAADAESAQGVGAHSDSGLVTLIADDGTPGLQVERAGAFCDVAIAPDELLVILGRALRDATGGATHAATHRVVAPSAGRARVSISYFLNPRLDFAGYGDEFLKVELRSHPETARRYFADLAGLHG